MKRFLLMAAMLAGISAYAAYGYRMPVTIRQHGDDASLAVIGVIGSNGYTCTVEYSYDLTNWSVMRRFMLYRDGKTEFVDPQPIGSISSRRFYRASQVLVK